MKSTPLAGAGIIRFEFTSFGSNVLFFKPDSQRVAIATKNGNGLPGQVIAKVRPSIDTIGYIYAQRTPTFTARVIEVASDSTAGYKLLSPSTTSIVKGSYQKVRE